MKTFIFLIFGLFLLGENSDLETTNSFGYEIEYEISEDGLCIATVRGPCGVATCGSSNCRAASLCAQQKYASLCNQPVGTGVID